MNQFARQTVFIFLVALNQSAKWRAGDNSHVAVEGVFVFLIRDERMNFAAADERDMPGLGATQILLEKNALGIVHLPQPRACVRNRLAQNRVDRARRRAERILDDERLRMFARESFPPQCRFDATKDLGNGNLKFRRTASRAKVAFTFNAHRFASRD